MLDESRKLTVAFGWLNISDESREPEHRVAPVTKEANGEIRLAESDEGRKELESPDPFLRIAGEMLQTFPLGPSIGSMPHPKGENVV